MEVYGLSFTQGSLYLCMQVPMTMLYYVYVWCCRCCCKRFHQQGQAVSYDTDKRGYCRVSSLWPGRVCFTRSCHPLLTATERESGNLPAKCLRVMPALGGPDPHTHAHRDEKEMCPFKVSHFTPISHRLSHDLHNIQTFVVDICTSAYNSLTSSSSCTHTLSATLQTHCKGLPSQNTCGSRRKFPS